ncbi:Mrp ATPases involved in chromosome partitioning [Mycobacteriaceae bacterium]
MSQERVQSYTQLLMGQTLAQRTIDKLSLDMTAATLAENVLATSKLNTVLITMKVLDESPVRARDIANALSDEFVVMVRELETPRPGSSPTARVVVEQRASIPAEPVSPNPVRNLALGLILGLLTGIGFAVIREQLDNTVKSQETLEEVTGAGVVGYIPFDKNIHTSPTLSFESDNSATAEAFRKLRTNLQFLAVDNPPRLIVVTSASPNEGKSTTAINIALALAEAEHNVVLVDGDLRRPSLARYLNLLGSVGFSTVLSGGAPLSDVLQRTKFSRLTLLAAGPIPPNPSELLGSLAAKRLLTDLRAEYDYVIIDSAPLLAVTDGAVLAAESDGALVAVRAGKTKREHIEHAVGMLHDVGAPLLGAVLTMMPTRGSGAYRYNHYYYGGGYGDGKPADSSSTPRTGASEFTAKTGVEVEQDLKPQILEDKLLTEAPPIQPG